MNIDFLGLFFSDPEKVLLRCLKYLEVANISFNP